MSKHSWRWDKEKKKKKVCCFGSGFWVISLIFIGEENLGFWGWSGWPSGLYLLNYLKGLIGSFVFRWVFLVNELSCTVFPWLVEFFMKKDMLFVLFFSFYFIFWHLKFFQWMLILFRDNNDQIWDINSPLAWWWNKPLPHKFLYKPFSCICLTAKEWISHKV